MASAYKPRARTRRVCTPPRRALEDSGLCAAVAATCASAADSSVLPLRAAPRGACSADGDVPDCTADVTTPLLRRLQAASTLCVTLGSAMVTTSLWPSWRRTEQSAAAMSTADEHRGGSSAEVAAALLLLVSLGLEAVAFRQRLQRRGPASCPCTSGEASVDIVSGGHAAEAYGKEKSTVAGDPWRWRRPRRQEFLVLGGLTALMAASTALGGGDAARRLGIVPRTWGGLLGIFFACFVHMNWRHCLVNALGVLLLGSSAFAASPALGLSRACRVPATGAAMARVDGESGDSAEGAEGVADQGHCSTFLAASAFIALTSGLCVWCLARSAVHAGASGMVCGYLGLLVALMLRRRDVPVGSLMLVLAVVACYGGAAVLARPSSHLAGTLYEACASRTTSSEHHTFGFLSGLAFVLLFVPARPPPNGDSRSSPCAG
eukprot:TRINITY_DN55096_c0_g1_i1.p1 TRINITY_DN55096_c0_g1~~TRINITY_DN55096_c0_g1_i1.p1  ORF type:complete len:434 (+),score=80.29 TRINITY_DN55096_c0_g1_i1:145-1446(+)